MLRLLVTAVAFLAAVAKADDAPQVDLCQKDVYPSTYVPGKTTAPLIQVSTSQSLNNANPVYCSGTFVFIDGCTFQVKNFTFLNAYGSKWYGGVVAEVAGKPQENQNAVTFVSDIVSQSNGGDQTFSLATTPGAAYSFRVVNQLRLFDLTQNQIICKVELPYMNPNVPGSNGGSTAATSTTAASGGSAAQTGKASDASSTVVGLFSLILAALFA
ncbi:hypothetical protein HDU79_009866 [Rhizoclosmatium sp. JEL0117]|nr:hypothetical protein HDU79_009866 [Rhizoclosmatium sp. JEL0117]